MTPKVSGSLVLKHVQMLLKPITTEITIQTGLLQVIAVHPKSNSYNECPMIYRLLPFYLSESFTELETFRLFRKEIYGTKRYRRQRFLCRVHGR